MRTVRTSTGERSGASVTAGGRRPRLVTLLGPAFVASIAYVDPGNVAANLSAGAEYGYLLVWVLVVANLMAVLVQYLSGKLGLVSGRGMPEILGQRLGRPARLGFWFQAELVAVATDIAEVIGGALALYILFDIPLLTGGMIIGAISLLLLWIRNGWGQLAFERVVVTFLVVITIGFVSGLTIAPVDWGATVAGVVPRLQGQQSLLLATSMLGATVMPHAIYLHSTLSRDRHGTGHDAEGMTLLLRAHRMDVVLALVVAGSVNIAMLLLAAAGLQGVEGTDTIEGAHTAVADAFGPVVGVLFGVGLLASGLASTSVGCYAGEAVMTGLLHIRLSLLVRRGITLIPALLLLAFGVDPTAALVLSQVVLSFGIPFAVVPLVRLTADRSLMGGHVNSRPVTVLAWAVAAVITVLNVVLLVITLGGS